MAAGRGQAAHAGGRRGEQPSYNLIHGLPRHSPAPRS
jgi:hypothetical protein